MKPTIKRDPTDGFWVLTYNRKPRSFMTFEMSPEERRDYTINACCFHESFGDWKLAVIRLWQLYRAHLVSRALAGEERG